jgi:release factor glutamine methyltransferase
VPTVGDIVKKTTEFFQAKSETARLDSELLIGKALGLERLQVFLKHDQLLSEEQLEKCRVLVRRRSKGEPVAYILGEKGFYKHSFEVTSATLIPRPETEMLVVRGLEILEARLPVRPARAKSAVQIEIAAAVAKRAEAERAAALAEAAHLGVDPDEAVRVIEAAGVNKVAESGGVFKEGAARALTSLRPQITIVDLGCGTGCIGLSIADEIKDRADIRLVFVDISAEALEVAKRNAKKLGLDEVSEFYFADAGDHGILKEGSSLGAPPALAAGRVDLVVANPPYIDPADTRIDENVKLFEPREALFAGAAGESGLAEIRRWSVVARRLARAALFEIGDTQGEASIRIFQEAGWDHVKLVRDLSNRERMIESHASHDETGGGIHG